METRQEQWQRLLDNFNLGEKEYLEGAYYRLRQHPDGIYELALIHGGPCGETLYGPRILVSQDLQPLEMLDNYHTPVTFLTYAQAPEQLQQALTELMAQFLKVKGNR